MEDKDFDAETADALDIDMRIYHEGNCDDKDANDLLDIHKSEMMRNGADKSLLDDEQRDSKLKINPFKAKHKKIGCLEDKKNFGRVQLQKLGWLPGQPIGNPSRSGLIEALDASDGKQPGDKTGIGYHGAKVDKEKLIELQKMARVREHRDSPFFIGSKFDNDLSKPDSLFKRHEPSLKYRLNRSSDGKNEKSSNQ